VSQGVGAGFLAMGSIASAPFTSCCHGDFSPSPSLPLDYSACTSATSRARLQFRKEGSDSKVQSVPRAGRNFVVGECVEAAYALVLEPGDLATSYLAPYLYPLSDGTNRQLYPWGWGLLYGRSASLRDANLTAEISWEEADDSSGSKPRCWIQFRVRRPIEVGEHLTVASKQNLPPIYAAAAKVFGNLEHDLNVLSCYDTIYITGPSQEAIELLEERSHLVSVEASPIHGLGCFASRNIEAGEVIEVAPCLPLEVDLPGSLIDDYTFEYDEKVQTTMLGYGSIYNHSDRDNVSHYKYHDNPYLEVWIADRFIEEGEELFHDYGAEYFTTRDIRLEDTSCC